MRCQDKGTCLNRYEGELRRAGERLERCRGAVQQFRVDLRLIWERRLDEVRGRLNRGTARLEALRRCDGDTWSTAAIHAEEAFVALATALDGIDEGMRVRALAA